MQAVERACAALLGLISSLATGVHPLMNAMTSYTANTSSIVSLHAPWPESLGRISRSAALAVRRAGPNTTAVTFTVPEGERRGLLALPGGRVVVEAIDASSFYAARAAADMVEMDLQKAPVGRQLAGRSGALPLSSDPPLAGSMAGYYT